MSIEARQFIRHPVDIPIHVTADSLEDDEQVTNVSIGGLCIACSHPFQMGEKVNICISLSQPDFNACGIVTWCRPNRGSYLVGISFEEEDVAFAVRMVEQICHIEDYRLKKQKEEGIELSPEQAAVEWISKYASDFPPIN
jgi:Tfp pilus assembly protein PilZ